MNILLVNHYIGSPYYGMDFRPYYISKEWVKMGHTVTMVGASQSHIRRIQPTVEDDLTIEMIDGIQYVWIKTPIYDKSSSVKRIKNILSFVAKATKYARRLAELAKPDWVIASSCYPLDIYPSSKIAKIAKAKLCFEVHDIWPLTPMLLGGYSKYHPFIMTMQMAENYMCRHSDKIVSLLWNAEEHYREHGFKGKFYCVPNGYCKYEWREEAFSMELPNVHHKEIERLKKAGKTIVGFAGGFAVSGAVDILVHSALFLKERDDIQIVLVGKGPELDNYKTFIHENGLENISILPEVPKQLVPAVVSSFDIGYLGGRHSILHKYGTSYNKMTDYMLCCIPIIQAVDEPGSAVERVKCGIRIEAENPVLLAKSIMEIASLPVEERMAMGRKGKVYVESNLEWGVLAQKFIEDLEA